MVQLCLVQPGGPCNEDRDPYKNGNFVHMTVDGRGPFFPVIKLWHIANYVSAPVPNAT